MAIAGAAATATIAIKGCDDTEESLCIMPKQVALLSAPGVLLWAASAWYGFRAAGRCIELRERIAGGNAVHSESFMPAQ